MLKGSLFAGMGGALEGNETSEPQHGFRDLGEARVALVLGSEGQGVSRAVRENIDSVAVSIPMLPEAMESLCVSQAGAILLAVFGRTFPELLAGVDRLPIL